MVGYKERMRAPALDKGLQPDQDQALESTPIRVIDTTSEGLGTLPESLDHSDSREGVPMLGGEVIIARIGSTPFRDLSPEDRSLHLSRLYHLLSRYSNQWSPIECLCLPILATDQEADTIVDQIKQDQGYYVDSIREFFSSYDWIPERPTFSIFLYESSQSSSHPDLDLAPHSTPHTILLAGTLDRLHGGHIFLLTVALLGRTATGTTAVAVSRSESLLARKKTRHLLESFENRSHRVSRLLDLVNSAVGGSKGDIEVLPLDDPVGAAIDDRFTDQTLIVSQDTISGGDYVNQARRNKGLGPMYLWELPELKLAEGAKLSSSEVRRQLNLKAEKLC